MNSSTAIDKAVLDLAPIEGGAADWSSSSGEWVVLGRWRGGVSLAALLALLLGAVGLLLVVAACQRSLLKSFVAYSRLGGLASLRR